MEEETNKELNPMTVNQELLINKVLKSRKFRDSEYKELKTILDKKVLTSYDASVFISYLLATINFRRVFLNGKHKSYKRCYFCKTRDNVERYVDLTTGQKMWICETCALNLDTSKIVRVSFQEKNEVKSDFYKKYKDEELTPEQEDLILAREGE